jgi:hypothetical protein
MNSVNGQQSTVNGTCPAGRNLLGNAGTVDWSLLTVDAVEKA